MNTPFDWVEILQHTSRSFVAGILQLRAPLSERIGLSYLLCRLLDTFEDSTHIPVPLRRESLALCRRLIELLAIDPDEALRLLEQWNAVVRPDQGWPGVDAWEVRLLREAPLLFRELATWPPEYRGALAQDVGEMARGMEQELEASIAPRRRRTPAETDRYCYYVAGTVGLLLTRFFTLELRSEGVHVPLDQVEAIGLGKALQLVNIIKDFHEDWRGGRCYWPQIDPPGTRTPTESELKRSLALLVDAFARNTALGERYLESLEAVRNVRPDIYLFCAFPLRLAQLTIESALRDLSWLAAGETPPKVPRSRTEELLQELLAN